MAIFRDVKAGIESGVGFVRDAVGLGQPYEARRDQHIRTTQEQDIEVGVLVMKLGMRAMECSEISLEEALMVGHPAAAAVVVASELQTAGLNRD